MPDLVSRLESAIAAKAEKARAASGRSSEWWVWDKPARPWGFDPLPDEVLAGGKPILRVNEEYGAGVADHIEDNDPKTVLAMCEAHRQIIDEWRASIHNPYEGKTDDELHEFHMHPDWQYATTEGQRKAWDYADEPPWDDELGRPGDGWVLNITSGHPDAFERFDYTEERYWRRLLPADKRRVWTPPDPPRYIVLIARGYGLTDTEETT